MKTHYQRYLPHILPPGETVFVTFRLHGSLPREVVERLAEEKAFIDKHVKQLTPEAHKQAYRDNQKRHFAQFDTYLDLDQTGQHWLKETLIAELVAKAIHQPNGQDYMLHAFCIMSNHVHLLLTIINETKSFTTIMQSLKGFTARKANELLGRTGHRFWQPESYDHVVRNNQEFDNVVAYILNNPVKAGLVDNWEDWPYIFISE